MTILGLRGSINAMDNSVNTCQEGSTVFTRFGDHQLACLTLTKGLAVFNTQSYGWTEYAGEEFLEDGDELHEVWMVG